MKKDVLEQKIYILKKELKEFDKGLYQGSLFHFYDGFCILDAYEVDDILCAGEPPFSTYMQDAMIEELEQNGVTTIISLLQEYEYSLYDFNVLKKKFNVVNIPMVGSAYSDIDSFYKVLHVIDTNKKTYIHCSADRRREKLFVKHYLSKRYSYVGDSLEQKVTLLQS
jgi:hypothetical protein